MSGFSAIWDLSALHQCTFWRAGRLTLKKLPRSPKAPSKVDHTFLPSGMGAGARDSHPWYRAPSGALPGDCERIADLASNQLFREGTPRSSARRVRMPLLSQPVMEACLTIPSWMWIAEGQNRAVARTAFADLLPRQVLNRRSKGTFMNYVAGVYRRNSEHMRRFLLEGQLESRGLLDSDAVIRHFNRVLPPRDRSFMRIFDLCMIENWVRQHA